MRSRGLQAWRRGFRDSLLPVRVDQIQQRVHIASGFVGLSLVCSAGEEGVGRERVNSKIQREGEKMCNV